MAFMHRLMRQHRLTDDIADGEDVRHVAAHLPIHADKAAFADRDAGPFRANLQAIGTASGRLQNQVITLCLGGCVVAGERDPQAIGPGLDRGRFGLEHDALEAPRVDLLPDLDQIAIRAGHQAVEHFHDVDARAQGRIHRGHFQADNAAADHQQPLGNAGQGQRAGGIDDARIIGQERQMHRLTASGNDAVFKTDHGARASLVLTAAGGLFDFDMVRIEELAITAHHLDLARLGHAGQTAGQFADHLIFVGAQPLQVDRGRAKADAEIGKMRRFVDHCRDMQQRLGGDAAHVQAYAAEGRVTLDQHGFQTQIGGAECS